MKLLAVSMLLFFNGKLLSSNIEMASLSLEYKKVELWLYIPKSNISFKKYLNKHSFQVVWSENEIYSDLKLTSCSKDKRFNILKLERIQ